MSADRRKPDQPQGGGVSNLERAFGFTDLAFRRYIKLRSTRKTSLTELTCLSSEMSANELPLVRYTGGWAAAEAGTLRVRERTSDTRIRNDTLPGRLQSLEAAQRIWEGVGEGFRDARGNESSLGVKADILGFELRAEQALAYLPSLQLTAMLMSGQEVSEQDRDALLKLRKERLLKLGERVIDLRARNKRFDQSREFASLRSGMMNEILSGLLLQEDDSPRFVIIPASIRQDNNSWGSLRSDLVAVSMEPTHPKSLIQISSEWDHRRNIKMRFLIEAPKDISLSGMRPRDTFRRLLERERSGVQPALSLRLDALSQLLADRLAAFTPA